MTPTATTWLPGVAQRDADRAAADVAAELIVDNFAGCGGASLGIEAAQVAAIGNSVPPELAEAIVRANFPNEMAAEAQRAEGDTCGG